MYQKEIIPKENYTALRKNQKRQANFKDTRTGSEHLCEITVLPFGGVGAEHDRGKNNIMGRCFSVGSVLVLAALAASMVVLPLILPPLPPPPLVLLFFPVGIMAALMLLAFSPSEANGRNGVVYAT
ncbi:transmembrane protein [Spatholobus suberectus]|nr:transmembrane protein [Spatholobus suberectus]